VEFVATSIVTPAPIVTGPMNKPFLPDGIFKLVSIYNLDFDEVSTFFTIQPNKFLFSLFVIFLYFYSSLSISEVFEDYIVDQKIKNVANKTLYLFAIIMPIFTIFILYKLSL